MEGIVGGRGLFSIGHEMSALASGLTPSGSKQGLALSRGLRHVTGVDKREWLPLDKSALLVIVIVGQGI